MRRFTQVCNAVLVITGLLAVPLSSYADPETAKGMAILTDNPKQGHKGNGKRAGSLRIPATDIADTDLRRCAENCTGKRIDRIQCVAAGNSQKSGQRETTAAGYCKESGSCLYA